jgi:hypothetical protein
MTTAHADNLEAAFCSRRCPKKTAEEREICRDSGGCEAFVWAFKGKK